MTETTIKVGRWLTHLTQLWVLGYAETGVAETAPSSECSDKSVTARRGAQLPLSYQRSRSCEKRSSVHCAPILSYSILATEMCIALPVTESVPGATNIE